MASLFHSNPDEPTADSRCRQCSCGEFTRIGTTHFWRCTSCKWLVRFDGSRPIDAIDWTAAGRRPTRKRGPRR